MYTQQQIDEIVRDLCRRLSPLFPQQRMDAILFGSYARGNAEAGSDIDVMILVDSSRKAISEKNWDIGDIAGDMLLDHGVVISPVVENREYFEKYSEMFPFYRNVRTEGVQLRG